MKVLITMMGRSTWGLFNSVWASIRAYGYLPERVHMLTAGCDRPQAERAAKMLSILLSEHGSPGEVLVSVVSQEDVASIARSVKDISSRERSLGHQVALDVTPGKKATVLGAILSGMQRNDFDHIFYLHIEALRNADRPYLEIPLGLQRCHDILAEAKDASPRSQEAA